jgi:hypothetical protein
VIHGQLRRTFRFGLVALAFAACAHAQPTELTLHVLTTPRRTVSSGCVFVITNPVVEGGHQTTCLTKVVGFPSAGGVIRSRGRMTFSVLGGAIRANVAIVLRFGADGLHARQTIRGTIVTGTQAYRGARGSLTGDGAVTDGASGLGPVRLVYRFRLTA